MNMLDVDVTRRYSAREIAKRGWIRSSRGTVSKDFVLRLIRTGVLPSQRFNSGKLATFLVKGSDIIAYKRNVEGVEV